MRSDQPRRTVIPTRLFATPSIRACEIFYNMKPVKPHKGKKGWGLLSYVTLQLQPCSAGLGLKRELAEIWGGVAPLLYGHDTTSVIVTTRLQSKNTNMGRSLSAHKKNTTSPQFPPRRKSGRVAAEQLIQSEDAHIAGPFVYCFRSPNRDGRPPYFRND